MAEGEKGKTPEKRKQPRNPLYRLAALILVIIPPIAGVLLFWRYVYLPAEVVTALRAQKGKAPLGFPYSYFDEIPGFVRDNYGFAVPYLVDALYGDDEDLALAAYASLLSRPEGVKAVRERFRPVEGGLGTFRAALLIEQGESRAALKGSEIPQDFRSRFLRWKARNRTGAFSLNLGYRLMACMELARLEKGRAIPFLLDLMKDPAASRSLAQLLPPLVVEVAENTTPIEEAYDIIVQGGLPAEPFLSSLLQREPDMALGIMKKALRTGILTQVSISLGYVLKHLDPDLAPLLEPLMVASNMEEATRRRIVKAISKVEEPWAAECLYRVLAKWPEDQALNLLSPGMAGHPLQRPTYFRLLFLAGDDPRPAVRRAALNCWVRWQFTKGTSAFKMYGTPVEGPLRTSFEFLSPPALGLTALDPDSRTAWLMKALGGLRSLEIGGKVEKERDRISAAAHAAAASLDPSSPVTEEPPEFLLGAARFAGRTLFMHRSVLRDPERIHRALVERVVSPGAREDVRLESTVWLAFAGVREQVVKSGLEEGMRKGPPQLRFASAAALARRGEASGFELLEKAWRGTNPVGRYLASCEVPHLPAHLLEDAIPYLLGNSTSKHRHLKTVSLNALSFILCVRPEKSTASARMFQKKYLKGELPDLWAFRATVVADQGGDPAVLEQLAGTMAEDGPEEARAAGLLLRHWTDHSMGYDVTIKSPGHAREIAARWKRWLEANRGSLVWDAETRRFR